MATLH